MDSSKFFIIGSNGQLGTALRKKYPNAKFADTTDLDITDSWAVDSFDWSGVTHILNAAAYTNVDSAETVEGRGVSWEVNAVAVANLSNVATVHNLTLVHISTDYVFDGTKSPHLEDEPFTPLGVYGQSKAAGDIAVSLTPKYYILRTTWVIGQGNNFISTMKSLAEKGVNPTVVSDQIGRLTFTSELVKAIDYLLVNKVKFGTYNVTNSGPLVSWADIARKTYEAFGHDKSRVSNITTEEYYKGKEGVAPRPIRSEMSLDKLRSIGFKSTDWRNDFVRYTDEVKKENI